MENKNVYVFFMPNYDPYKYFYQKIPGEYNLAYTFREELEKSGLNLKIANYSTDISDAVAVLSWADLNERLLFKIKSEPKHKCILLTFEPPVVDPRFYNPALKELFGSIFTMIDDIVDYKNYFKILTPPIRTTLVDDIPDFSDKKFCVMINSNKNYNGYGELYSERRKAISFFCKSNEFDLFGYDWNGVSCWKGIVVGDDKLNTLKNYKYCVCYENMTNQRGYVSEKINEVLVSGCVPIYFGATNIQDYVPSECFIDFGEFLSYPKLYSFLKAINRDRYADYLHASQNYINSDKFSIFSTQYISKQIIDRICCE